MKNQENAEGEAAAILDALRRSMKAQGLRYADVAERLGMSESGLKKIFAANDPSLGRLAAICKALGTSLHDVVSEALASPPMKEVVFSQELQEFFLGNMACFNFYWKLAYEEMTPEAICSQFGLTKATANKYLRSLDRYGLVELHPGDAVKVPQYARVTWRKEGPFVHQLMKTWAESLVGKAIEKPEDPENHFSLRYYRLTSESYADLLRSIEDINREFATRSFREIKFYPSDQLKTVSMVAAAAPRSYVERI